MPKPTTPKPAQQARVSAKARRRKVRPADRLRSVGCAPLGTSKLLEKRRTYVNGGLRSPNAYVEGPIANILVASTVDELRHKADGLTFAAEQD